MPFSQYLADSTLNWFRGSAFVAAPGTNVFVSLHSSDPGPTGANGDVTVTVAGGRATLPIASLGVPVTSSVPGGGREISNTSALSLTSSAPGSAVVTHFGIWSAATGGNFLAYGTLAVSVEVFIGDVLQFAAGQLVIRGL